MPLYQYQCPKCLKQFERSKPIEKRNDTTCPDCKVKANLVICPVPHYWKDPP
jgi:putative FmdB family regulatory protein